MRIIHFSVVDVTETRFEYGLSGLVSLPNLRQRHLDLTDAEDALWPL